MAAPPAPALDPSQIRRITQEVLARPEFRRPGRPLLQRVEDAIGRALSRALVTALSGRGSLLGSVVILAVAAALLLLIWRFARTVRRQPSSPLGLMTGPSRPATDWDADAAAHERAGRWRDVIRCRYRAAVAALAGRGLVEEYDGRTTGEYRQAVDQGVPQLAGPFDRLTELFERAWYGDQPAGEADAATATRFRHDIDALASTARSATARHPSSGNGR